jgi:hypothetical protein
MCVDLEVENEGMGRAEGEGWVGKMGAILWCWERVKDMSFIS